MAEKKDVYEKLLNNNYGTVQKKEIKVVEDRAKLSKDFSSNTEKLSKTLIKEMKEHKSSDKGIKDKFTKQQKVIDANHLTHIKDIESRVKSFEVKHQEELKSSLDKFNNLSKELDSQKEELGNNYEAQVKDLNEQYTNNIETSESAKVEVTSSSDQETKNLLSQLKDTQDKYEALVVNLNEKKEAKLEKLNVASTKKIEKINSDIEKEQLKTDKSLADLNPPYEEKLADIDGKLATEKEKYQKKETAIKSTVESKVARHEKFMNKSLKDNDQRAVKQHRKEIVVLEKNAEKELKLLAKEHSDKFSILGDKKKALLTLHRNNIAELKSKFIKLKEEKLYQIELTKVTLSNDLNMAAFETRQQLEDELNKYNDYFAENDNNQAEINKAKDINLGNQEDQQVNLKITLDKEQQVNEVKHQDSLAAINSKFVTAEFLKASEEQLSKIALDVELKKLEIEKLISEKELVQLVKINDEQELIEYHGSDFNKQTSIRNEYLAHQLELTKLYNTRAITISEYEELEVTNRMDLKVAFLEDQKVLLLKDNEAIIKKINQLFESEKAMFDVEISKLAESALEELAAFELSSNEEIDAMVKKRNTLDPRAYKKEVKALDREIAEKKERTHDEVQKRKASISSKTILFNKGIEEATARKEKALSEIENLNNNEQTRIENTIELVNRERNDELLNIKEHISTMTNDTDNFSAQAESRKNVTLEENTNYQNARVEKEEVIIKDTKALFEQEKHSLNTKLEEALANLESDKANSNRETSNKKLKEEEALESISKENDSKINKIVQDAQSLTNEQEKVNKDNVRKIESKYSNHLARVSSELRVKLENYKTKLNEINKEISEEGKSFDISKKQIQRDYEAALAKGLDLIKQKLQQELKNL